jgi:acetyl esterase
MKSILGVLMVLSIAPTFAASAPTPDTDMKTVLDALDARHPKALDSLTAVEAREQPSPADAAKDVIIKKEGKFTPEALSKVEDKMIDGADGQISARFYTPAGKGPMPVIVYYHGGGFVIATNDTYDASPRALANGANAIVVSVEYRKAPEHKFPAAHEDAFAAYKWVLANAASFNGDPKRIAVAGESAGGNLALNVALMARDAKIMIPTHELLIYPVAGTDTNTESYKTNANAQPLSKAAMGWFVKNFTNSPADLQDKRLNLLSADFKGLNPATIITAEIDPLMTEGKELSIRMESQGVKVSYKNYDGVTHEFFGMAPVVAEAKDAQTFATTNLKQAFTIQAQEATP